MTTTVELPRPGILEWALSTDHKRVGVRVVAWSLVFFAASGALALVMRAELARPGLQVVSHDTYDQLFTMHGSGMFFLVMAPLALALGVYLAPLQVGATGLWAPRAALLGESLFVLGGLTMFTGFLTTHGAARAGWTAFYPLSDAHESPGYGMDMWIAGVVLATAGSILLALCVLMTLLRLRAPGLTLMRLPVFSWSMVVTCLLVLASFPVLIVAMALLFVDRHWTGVFDTAGGPAAYQHLFWFYGHPVVYVTFFPFVGAVCEVVAVFSRRRFFGYGFLVASLLLFTALSMSVWAHHMFTTGQVTNQYFSLTSTLLIVPAGIEYFDILATMISGKIVLRTPMLFAIGFVLLFLVGGLTGIIVASPPLDYHVHDSFFVVGHFHYTLFAGSLFGFFAAVYYWFPKATGRLLGEGLGRLHFALLFVGANLAFFPMFVLGYEGMPRRVPDYPDVTRFDVPNLISSIGAGVIALGLLVFAWNLLRSLRRGAFAGDDPWQGHTLEWATASPPPRENFVRPLPPVTSFAPLLDGRQA